MAKKEGYVVDLNKLYRYDDNTGKFVIPKALWANGKEHYAAFSNGSICYNKAYYELYLEDTVLVALASGEIMDPYVYVSKKTDFDGSVFEVPVTDNLKEIQPNYSLTEEKYGTFEVTQEKSNFVLTGTYRQRKDSYTDEYYNLQITYVVGPLIPAAGGERPLTIGYSVVRKRRYESGKPVEEGPINSTTTSFVSVDVNTTGDSSFDESTGYLSGYNLGYNEKDESTIATIKYVKIELHGLNAEWSGSQVWRQEANERQRYGDPVYHVSLAVDGDDNVLPGTTYVWLNASAIVTQKYIYTAMPDNPRSVNSNATATLWASSGANVSPTTITGSNKSAVLSFEENNDETSRTHTAYIKAGDAESSVSVIQLGGQETGSWEAPVATGLSFGEIPASGRSIEVNVSYTQNYVIRIGNKVISSTPHSGTVVASSIEGSRTSGSTAVVSGGKIGAGSLGTTLKTTTTPQFNITGGTYVAADGNSYSFNLTGTVVQSVNMLREKSRQNVYNIVDPEDLLGGSATLYLQYQAQEKKVEQWDSDENGSYLVNTTTNISMIVSISGAYTGEKTVSGTGSTSFNIGANSTTSDRVFKVKGYDPNYKLVVPEFEVTQFASKEEYYWEEPVETGLSYGEIPASGRGINIYVIYNQRYVKKVGSTITPVYDYTGHRSAATSISGSKYNSSATGSVSGSTVMARSLGTTLKTTTTPQFNITGGTYVAADGNSYPFNLTGTVVQSVNMLREKSRQNVYSIVDPEDLLGGSTTLFLQYQAQEKKVEQWDSDENGSYLVNTTTNISMIVSISGAYTGEKTVSGTGSTSFNIGANSTTSDRVFKVKGYDPNYKLVVPEFEVTQFASKEEYYWEAPTANSLTFSEIPASGAAISVYVNYTQRYMKKIGNVATPVYTNNSYTATALSISGSKYNSTSTAYISGASIAASSLGTNPKDSSTPQFNITGGTYKAADGNTYNFTLTGLVYQAKNVKGTPTTTYAVGLSPSSRTLSALGGTVYFAVTALKTDSYTWSSGSKSEEKVGGTASISATGGTVPASAANGTNMSFYKDMNTSTSSLSYTITATYQGKKATASVTQEAASYTFTYVQPSTISSDGGEFRVYLNSYMSGSGLKPTATVNRGASVTAINELSSPTVGNIEVVLKIPANAGSARTFTLTVTQPYSGKSHAITLNQEKFTASFSISLNSSSYFKKTATNTYQLYATMDIQSNQAKTVSGKWYYTPINEDGLILGLSYEDPKGTQSISVPAYDTTSSFTGTAIYMSETAAAGFAGIRAEFRSSDTGASFSRNIFNIK